MRNSRIVLAVVATSSMLVLGTIGAADGQMPPGGIPHSHGGVVAPHPRPRFMPPPVRVDVGRPPPSFQMAQVQSIELSCARAVAEQKICDTSGQCRVARTPCFPYECDHAANTCASSCTGGGIGMTGLQARGTCQYGALCVDGQCVAAVTQPIVINGGNGVALPNGAGEQCDPYAVDPVTGNCVIRCNSTADCTNGTICNSDSTCSPPQD